MPKQEVLIEDPNVPKELIDAAEEYATARDARMSKTKVEVQTKGSLIAKMKTHKLRNFRMPDGRICEILKTGPEKVRVRKPKEGRAPKAGKRKARA
jgi:uncharacterized ubiquitin-like protein YukD